MVNKFNKNYVKEWNSLYFYENIEHNEGDVFLFEHFGDLRKLTILKKLFNEYDNNPDKIFFEYLVSSYSILTESEPRGNDKSYPIDRQWFNKSRQIKKINNNEELLKFTEQFKKEYNL